MFKRAPSLRQYSEKELAKLLLKGLIVERDGFLLPAISGAVNVNIAQKISSNDVATPTSRTTASFSITSGNVYMLSFRFDRDPGILAISGNSQTYDVVRSADPFDSTMYMYIYRFRASLTTSGGITITNTIGAVCMWSVEEVTNMDTSGTNGAGAIGDTKFSSGSSTIGTVTALTLRDSSSACYAVFAHRANEGTTPGVGFTELADRNIGTFNSFQTEWKLNETIASASWASGSAWGGQSIEVRAPASVVASRQLKRHNIYSDAISRAGRW